MPPASIIVRASAAAAAFKTPAPTPYLRRRGDINASLASTISAGTAVLQQQASTTATSSAPSSTSSQYSNNGGWFGGVWGGNFSTNWVTWVSIAVLVGLLIGISTARFFYIRRYYPPTWRSYFLPAKGLHINRFGIHIRGPPPRVPREHPPPYIFATELGPHGRRRRRRGRQTVGATVGEGGARIGERDQDDMWDVDLVGGADGAIGPAGTPGLVRDELPRYFVDGGLPMYEVGDGSAAEEAERIRAEAAASSAAGADALETLPTAAEYEAASRAARNNAAESGNAHAENQHDRVRGEEGLDNNSDGGAAYPPRPPPVARTTTGRSSILGAFTRGGNLQRPPLTTNPSGTTAAAAADDSRDSADSSSSASTSTVSTTLDVLPAIGRTASLESGATGSSSSVDQDPLGKGPVTKSKAMMNRPGLREASSSMVKIDADVTHKEEAAASVESQEDDGESHEEERDDAAPPDRKGQEDRHPDSARDARRD